MFDFDEIDIDGCFFTYHTESYVASAYSRYLEETQQRHTPYKKKAFIFEYVKEEIMRGYRKHHEYEQEWERLKFYIEDLHKQSIKGPTEELIPKAYILYDQCLLLAREGFTIPNIK